MINLSLEAFQSMSMLNAEATYYIEGLYEAFLAKQEIPDSWKHYFETVNPLGIKEANHSKLRDSFQSFGKKQKDHPCTPRLAQSHAADQKQIAVLSLIMDYRLHGHSKAQLDPLGLSQRLAMPELTLDFHGLSSSDLKKVFEIDHWSAGPTQTLEDIIHLLDKVYCGNVAVEYMHIAKEEERRWVQEQVESVFATPKLEEQQKRDLLELLIFADGLAKYLSVKYPGAKRFGLEGAETFLIALDNIIQQGGVLGAREIVIGMAHRGRLNVLVNILGKHPQALVAEFEGTDAIDLTAGDVKYHQGFSSNRKIDENNTVHLSLAFNPSHLELVSTVVCGSVRARQARIQDETQEKVFPILIHGDAAFAGQGVVMENLNMSQTRGFSVGGSVHIIINNQIGFTTNHPKDARSTPYCSDVAKMLQAPVFHVNGDDPEAVFLVSKMALEYRMKYKKDVVIDLVCYRRYGHNEADDPSVTQPLMYQMIKKHPTTIKLYQEKLIQEGSITADEVNNIQTLYRNVLEGQKHIVAKNILPDSRPESFVDWSVYTSHDWREKINTGLPKATLISLANLRDTLPKDMVLHPRIQKIVEARKAMTKGTLAIDWGYAETLAYATLLFERYPVRLTGQDAERGTFFHRHVVMHCQKTGHTHLSLCHLSENQASFCVTNSLLSELGVLGFEYGYASSDPHKLVIWEAQFGDFANGAQAMIDQFVSSGEHKWGRYCGLVMLLPHGYEGQGPEHSSARLERYLQLCAKDNMQVCVPTTPAQIFHLLRRQMLRSMRKPLVVLTPKSLLRHKKAVSSLNELESGHFSPVITEHEPINAANVSKLLLCSGKIYYDLLAKREGLGLKDVPIFRLEQLYPFPDQELKQALADYPKLKRVVWCQEEPLNQGAWYSAWHHFDTCLAEGVTLEVVAREAASSPAVGYLRVHLKEQEELMARAFQS